MANLDRVYKTSKIAGIVLMSLSVAYYLAFFLPEKEKYKREMEEKKKTEQELFKKKEEYEQKITACLGNAERIRSEVQEKNAKHWEVLGIQIFDDIFYSSKLDKCVYIVKYTGNLNMPRYYAVYDATTDSSIESTGDISEESYASLVEKYKDTDN